MGKNTLEAMFLFRRVIAVDFAEKMMEKAKIIHTNKNKENFSRTFSTWNLKIIVLMLL